jgi:site-specific recombinase XerD
MLASEAVDLFNDNTRRRVMTRALTQTSADNYARDLADFLAVLTSIEGDIPVSDIGVRLLDELFEAYGMLPDRRRKDEKSAHRTPRSARTKNRFYSSTSALFSFLCLLGEVPSNPVKGAAGKMKLKQEELDPKRLSLNKANLERLLDVELTARDEFILRVLATAGTRVGELCACDTDDLTYDSQHGCWWLRLRMTKNGKPRSVGLSDSTVAFYTRYRDHDIVAPASRPNGLPVEDAERALLRTSRGRRITPRDLQNLLKRLGPASGVHITPHGLRHTAATLRVKEGFDVHVVRDLLGHSSIAVTSQYLDSDSADLAAMATSTSVDAMGRAGRPA